MKNALRQYNHRQTNRWIFVTLVLCVILLILSILHMTMGNTTYTLQDVIQILLSDRMTGAAYTIKKLRLPKLLVGIMAGASFGMAGHTFQTILRNPLASPDIIGITSGSSAAAVFCILILHVSGAFVSVVSIVVGLLVTVLILVLSNRNDQRMILIGIGFQAILSALISWMLMVGSEYDVASALRWLRGSLNAVTLEDIGPLFLCFVLGTIGLIFLQRPLRMMQLGEEYAIGLGVKTSMERLGAFSLALLLTAGAASITGPIASIAFLSSPIASRLTSRNKSALITSALVGSILVLAGELIGQNGFQTRFPVGVITGILGAPYLLFLLYQINRKEG